MCSYVLRCVGGYRQGGHHDHPNHYERVVPILRTAAVDNHRRRVWPGERGCFFEHVLQHVDAQLFVFPHPNAIENLRNTLENSTMLDAADSDEREAAAAPEEASSELPEALMYSNLVDRTSMLLPILRVDAAVATALGLNSRHRGPPPSSPLTSVSVPPGVNQYAYPRPSAM